MRRVWVLLLVCAVGGVALGVAGERWRFEDKTALALRQLDLDEADLGARLEKLTKQVVELAGARAPGKPPAAGDERAEVKAGCREAWRLCMAHEAACLKLSDEMPDGICQKYYYLEARGDTDWAVHLLLALELGELPWDELPVDAIEEPAWKRSDLVNQALQRAKARHEDVVDGVETEQWQLSAAAYDFDHLRF